MSADTLVHPYTCSCLHFKRLPNYEPFGRYCLYLRSVASNMILNLMLPIISQPIPGVVPLDEHGQFSAFAFWLMDKGYTFEEPNTDLHINSFKVCRDVSR